MSITDPTISTLASAVTSVQTLGIQINVMPAGATQMQMPGISTSGGNTLPGEIITWTGYTGSGPYTLTGVTRTNALAYANGTPVIVGAITAALLNSGDPIVIAASNTTANQQNEAINSGGVVCTGSNDDLLINSILNAAVQGAYIKLVGTFNTTQMIRLLAEYSTLDLTEATFNVPVTWAASGRAVIHLGRNHQIPLGTVSLPGGTDTAVLFSDTSGGGAAGENGDGGYLYNAAGTYTGLSSSTKYYIVNYTPTGFGNATFNLALTPNGSPVTASAIASGETYSLVTYSATSGASNTITLTDPTVTSFPDGTAIIVGITSATGLGTSTVFYTQLVSGVTFNLYVDPQLSNEATITASGVLGFTPMMFGPRVVGGNFNAVDGITNYMVVVL